MRRILNVLIMFIILTASVVAATDYYVDGQNGNDNNNGSFQSPFKTLTKASETVRAGDLVYIRAGIYTVFDNDAVLYMRYSGTSGNQIIWQNYNDEEVILRGQRYGIKFNNQEYVTVDGLTIDNISIADSIMEVGADFWGAEHCTIKNCTIRHMTPDLDTGGRSVHFLDSSHYNKCLNCTIEYSGQTEAQGNDMGECVWIDGTHNLVQGCTLRYAGHGTALIGGNYNILRDNIMYNTNWGRVFQTANPNESYRQLVEDNIIRDSGDTEYGYPNSNIQLSASNTIFRRNRVYNSVGNGGDITAGNGYDCDNIRIYHNVIYNSGIEHDAEWSYGLSVSEHTDESLQNLDVRNNIFYANYKRDVTYDVFLRVIWGHHLDPEDLTNVGNHWDNDGNPKFANPGNGNFSLESDTPCIDKGAWLTTITSATGSGTSFVVADARFFCDGWGVISGDEIQLENQTQTARITNVNYGTNTITINKSLSWHSGQGVSLPYAGYAPDPGAYEYTGSPTPSPLYASANGSPGTGYAPLTVNFTGSASGGTSPYSYRWTFGDGGSSTSQNPSHTYSSAGSFTATLTVTDSLSATASKSVTITVTSASSQLIAMASASPTSGQAPLAVNFTGSASGGTSPYSYRWTFGDGGSSTSQNPSHTYSSAGSYTATLTVTDGSSATASATASITVGTPGTTATLSLTAATGSPSPGQGGTTDPAPGTYFFSVGSSAQPKSIPYTDYRFSKWGGDVSESVLFNTEISVAMNTNKSLTSTFCTKCADVNGDLKITPADAQAAFDVYLKKITNPTWCELENADVNSSGTKLEPKVTPADAQMIFNKYLKKGTADGTCSGNSRAATTSTRNLGLPAVKLAISNSAVSQSGDILIPIILESPSAIAAFGFDLLYSSKQLTFLGLERTELTNDFDPLDANVIPYLMSADEGRSAQSSVLPTNPPDSIERKPADTGDYSILRVGGYQAESVTGPSSGVLITLIFRVKGEVEDSSSISIIAAYDDIQNASISNGAPQPEINRVERQARESVPEKRISEK